MENEINLKNIIENGAIVIDVRTVGEYNNKHVKGSINIPLDQIEKESEWLVRDVPTIVCCETGSRSAVAEKILKAYGFEKVYNGGNCNRLGQFGGGSCPVK